MQLRSRLFLYVLATVFALGLPTVALAQAGGAICMTPEPELSPALASLVAGGRSPEIVGAYSETAAFADSVHALVVFVHFSNDTAATSEWPIQSDAYGETLPTWGTDLVH